MITVPASEFSKNFGRYRDIVQREPVAVTNHERVTGYFLSKDEYEEYLKVKSMMPKAYAIEELSDATIQSLINARMDSKHNHLNSLLEE